MRILPIKTVPGVEEKDVAKNVQELENQGYIVFQRKKVVDAAGKSTYTLQAKLNGPPDKPGRILV